MDSVVFNGNLFIEALPFAKSEEEVKMTFNRIPELPNKKDFQKLPEQIQEMALSKLEGFRIALPFHVDIEKEFNRTLVESYAGRVLTKAQNYELMVEGVPYKVSHKLRAYHSGEATNGFAMLGVAGSGKSTAMNMVLDHYPQVIIHEFKDETVVQIVYLFVTCETNSNFNALYKSIAEAIDNALGNGNNACAREIENIRSGGLGAKSAKIREFVEQYSIGIIIFDEIQNIDLRSTRENSLEALLTLNNTTHVGLGVLGTEDAFYDLFSKDRTVRRFSAFIAASRYCKNYKTFINIINGLFLTQIFETEVYPSADIIKAFYDESDGVIAHAVLLYYYILKDYISRKTKPEVTAAYVYKIGKTSRKIIHDRIMKNHESTFKSNVARNKVISEMNSYGETEERVKRETEFTDAIAHSSIFLKGTATQIIMSKNKNYTVGAVENAVEQAIERGADTEDTVVSTAVDLLKDNKVATRPQANRKDLKEIDIERIRKEILGETE